MPCDAGRTRYGVFPRCEQEKWGEFTVINFRRIGKRVTRNSPRLIIIPQPGRRSGFTALRLSVLNKPEDGCRHIPELMDLC